MSLSVDRSSYTVVVMSLTSVTCSEHGSHAIVKAMLKMDDEAPVPMRRVVAQQVRRHRLRLGMTVPTLAARCKKLGAYELTTAALSNIERGGSESDSPDEGIVEDAAEDGQRTGSRRGRKPREVTVEELWTLGIALSVPPALLMVPLGTKVRATVADTPPIAPHQGWLIFVGAQRPSLPTTTVDAAAWNAGASLIRTYEEFEALLAKAEMSLKQTRFQHRLVHPGAPDPEGLTAHQRDWPTWRDFAAVITEMVRNDFVVPPIPRVVAEELTSNGLVPPAAVAAERESDA
jgi:transcriptional regulator with XRE-family HTH domain